MDFETYERDARARYDDFARAVSLILEAVIRTQPALRLQTVTHRASALEAIIKSDNNNDRFHSLERLADYVLPYYDDLESEWPQIIDFLADAVKIARKTPPVPIEHLFGALPPKTCRYHKYRRSYSRNLLLRCGPHLRCHVRAFRQRRH